MFPPRIPKSLAVGSGKQICWGIWPLSTFWVLMRRVSPRRLQHVQINLHLFHMEPLRKGCYFLQTEQNSTLLTCLLSPECIFWNGGIREGSPGRSEVATVWAWRLPADKWSISAARTGPGGLPLPWTHKPVSNPQFCTGICPGSRYFGVQWCKMPSSFFWNLQERLLWKERL